MTLPALRSRLSWARAVRISFALLRAFILCSLVLSGTAAEVSTGGAIGRRRLYVRLGDVQAGICRIWRIHFDLRLRSMATADRTVVFGSPETEFLAAPAGPARRPPDRETRRFRRRSPRPRPPGTRRHGRRSRSRPSRSPESTTARGHPAHLIQRDRPDRRAGEARRCRRRATARVPPGAIAIAFSVLISETASAPPSSAAIATAAGIGDVRRELHDQRPLGQRAQLTEQAERLGGLLADDQAGLDVRA